MNHTFASSLANYCGDPSVTIHVQNFGTNVLSAYTINVYEGATVIGTKNWTGSLASHAAEAVTIDITGNSADDFTITKVEISTADDNATNNVLTEDIAMSKAPVVNRHIGMDVLTDDYAYEFAYILNKGVHASTIYNSTFFESWSASGHVESMLNYQGQQQLGSVTSIANATNYWHDINLNSDGCYTMKIWDQYGDGFGGSSGYAKVGSAGTELFNSGVGGAFNEVAILFEADATVAVGIEEAEIVEEFVLYPNPATTSANIKFNINGEHDATLNVVNSLGQSVYTESLYNLNGEQVIEFSTSDLESGFYMVSLNIGNDVITTTLSVIK